MNRIPFSNEQMLDALKAYCVEHVNSPSYNAMRFWLKARYNVSMSRATIGNRIAQMEREGKVYWKNGHLIISNSRIVFDDDQNGQIVTGES